MKETININTIKSTDNITFYSADTSRVLLLPFVFSGIVAGFSRSAEDYFDIIIELNCVLI